MLRSQASGSAFSSTSGMFLDVSTVCRPNKQTVFVTGLCPDSHSFMGFETLKGDKVITAPLR